MEHTYTLKLNGVRAKARASHPRELGGRVVLTVQFEGRAPAMYLLQSYARAWEQVLGSRRVEAVRKIDDRTVSVVACEPLALPPD